MAVFSGNGSNTAPSFTFSSDTDTGMYRVGTNELGLTAGGTNVVRINSSSHVGIATAPADRLTVGTDGTEALEFGSAGSGSGSRILAADRSGTAVPTPARIVSENLGLWTGSTFASLTAPAFFIDSVRRVGIGTDNPSSKTHIRLGTATGYTGPSYDGLAIERDSNTGITIATTNTTSGWVLFADGDDPESGALRYDHSGDEMIFRTNNANRMFFNSGGQLLINTNVQKGVPVLQTLSNGVGRFMPFGFSRTGLGQNPTSVTMFRVLMPAQAGVSASIMMNVRFSAYQNLNQGGERSATYSINLLRISANGGTGNTAIATQVTQIGTDVSSNIGSYSANSLTVTVSVPGASNTAEYAEIQISGTSTAAASDSRCIVSGTIFSSTSAIGTENELVAHT